MIQLDARCVGGTSSGVIHDASAVGKLKESARMEVKLLQRSSLKALEAGCDDASLVYGRTEPLEA